MSREGDPVHAEIPCNSGYYFMSVIGYGEVIFIEDEAEKCADLSVMFKHQTGVVISRDITKASTRCFFIDFSPFL